MSSAQKTFSIIMVPVIFFLVFFSFNMLFDSSEPVGDNLPTSFATQPTASPSVDIISINAVVLAEEYAENEIRANETYLDKTLEVTGVIGSIGVNVLNQNYITVGDGTEYDFDAVYCTTAEGQNIPLSSLEKGKTVVVRGTYIKNTLGPALDNCVIISLY